MVFRKVGISRIVSLPHPKSEGEVILRSGSKLGSVVPGFLPDMQETWFHSLLVCLLDFLFKIVSKLQTIAWVL